jgi:hypothetical protein
MRTHPLKTVIVDIDSRPWISHLDTENRAGDAICKMLEPFKELRGVKHPSIGDIYIYIKMITCPDIPWRNPASVEYKEEWETALKRARGLGLGITIHNV